MDVRFLFLLAVLLAQDSGYDGLVQRLGDPDPDVREQAAMSLAKSVEPAREALERGRLSPDAEIRVRAGGILHRHERAELERKLEREQRPRKLGPATDAGLFVFRRRAWAPKGSTLGTIFDTATAPSVPGEIEWDVAGVSADEPLKVERCLYHSPGLVYVPGADVPESRVTLKGLRRWYCDIPVEFRDPSRGASERVGPYLVVVRWPVLQIRADRPVLDSVFQKALDAHAISFRVKPGRERYVDRRYTVAGGYGIG